MDEKTEQTGELPINTKLLNEALKLKEERRILKDRIAKVEENRANVSENVFKKVHSDYQKRQEEIDHQLLEKKQEIDRELATLFDSKDKIEANLKSHKEKLEELDFRYKLGEYGKEEYQAQSKVEKDKIGRFEKILLGVQNNIKRYEGIFEGEEDLFGGADRTYGEEKPLSEEIIDEWEQEAIEAQKKPFESPKSFSAESTNPGEPEWEDSTKPNLAAEAVVAAGKQAKLTVIAGHEDIGKDFFIKEKLTIGRSQSNQIILRDSKASRQHAEIKYRGGDYLLVDLNSSNGTLVNGSKVHEAILTPNDEIQVGDTILQFQQ